MTNKLATVYMELSERIGWPDYYEPIEVLRERNEFLSEKLLETYDPDMPWDYLSKLSGWLENATSQEEKYLLLSALRFFTFFNREQYCALYEEAFESPIRNWIIERNKLDIFSTDIDTLLGSDIGKTCFSAATDSMDISTFMHVNQLTGRKRLTWTQSSDKSQEFWGNERASICATLSAEGCKNIVVMEDFIGSGRQIKGVIDFMSMLTDFEILILPLVICPQGDKTIKDYLAEKEAANLSYSPVIVMPWDFVLDNNRPAENEMNRILKELSVFAKENHSRVLGDSGRQVPFLGFNDVGALFAKYTNCPNNTLPLFWFTDLSSDWNPLFPRIERSKN